jgi:hypothetical protein
MTINPNLIPYRVMLHEEPGDKFQIVFDCMAEDDDQAVEQAEKAYPGCDIITYLPFDNTPLLYVIYSPNESAINDGAGFWSNQNGWTELDEATKFLHSEKQTLNLPISTGQDAKWVLYDEAREHCGSATTEAIKAFQHEVGICIDCMLQDDACGQTMVFVRENGKLVPKVVSPDAIDLENLQQYEMILFDGGNSAGDTWKHTFFPKQLQGCFVDENPLPRKELAACNVEVSLDGGVTYQPAPNGVRIVYKEVMIDGEDGRGEVHINATHEGLITDIWTTRDEPLDHNIGTDSVLIEDIVSRLVEEND